MTAGPSAAAQADLEACAREPIQHPGSIQPHGCLLWAGADGTILHASANVDVHLGVPVGAMLGTTLAAVLGAAGAARLETSAGGVEPDPVVVEVGGIAVAFDVAVHRPAHGELVVELEPVGDDQRSGAAWYQSTRQVFQRLQRAADVVELAAIVCEEVRALTGFDRVMVYRFDADYAGEVIAEARRDDLEPLLGLWYPATDIPAQARALYLRNHIRLIADAAYQPVPIEPPVRAGGEPLDLSDAVLRSVSPVHLEYLRNMGVASSMSVSLVERDRLWGLIACHHEAGARRPPLRVRAAAEFIGEAASLVVESLQRTAADRRRADAAGAQRVLNAVMANAEDAALGLASSPALLAMVGASGAALRLGGALHLAGATPPAEHVDALVDAVLVEGHDVGLADAVPDEPLATGVLAVRVAGAPDHSLAWFRPEVLRTVEWGGDPSSKTMSPGGRIGPRVSFARWSEAVRGRAWPWTDADVEAAQQLGRLVGDVLLRRARQQEALAAALHRAVLLEELPDLPGLELAARYDAGGAGLVGGDWYDLVYRPDGRVVASVGDVAGHGLAATGVTAQLRNALRAYVLTTTSPGEALTRLNHLARQLLPAELATAVVVEVDPARGALRLASAGHLPALVVGPDGARLLAAPRAPGVGMVPAPTYATTSFELGAGEALFLYSDGLVERRGEGLDAGLERLVSVASDLPDDLDEACGELLRRVRGVATDDDVTVLAVRPRR